MDVKVAESAGFCYGVKRAVDMARETARQGKPCVMLGSIIHNTNVVEELEALYKGVGAKYLPEHIGIDPALADEMLTVSAAIRNRLTLVRMRRVLDFE